MNILYITFVDVESNESIGVKKKIIGQVEGMRSNGHKVSYTICEKNSFIYVDYQDNKSEIYKFKNNKHKRMYMYNKNLINVIKSNEIDTIYMRYALSDFLLIRFLKKVKKLVKKIYIEIPTYPYDNEISDIKCKIDSIFRKYLYKYVDKIILSSQKVDKVFNIPTEFVNNGVSIKEIKYVNREYSKSKKTINLIGVSFIRKSNGYDRLILGIRDYYLNKNIEKQINVQFIGDGSEVNNLKELVDKYNLNDYIHFEGIKSGDELDEYFEKADIAIGSLGDHRSGIEFKSPLKSREYCARGIPFISATKDPGFDGNEKFILNIKSNDDPININEIVKFYEDLSEIENVSEYMRRFAYSKFDWKSQFENIF